MKSLFDRSIPKSAVCKELTAVGAWLKQLKRWLALARSAEFNKHRGNTPEQFSAGSFCVLVDSLGLGLSLGV